jgi:DNA-binding transcriptional ArsR family regulator
MVAEPLRKKSVPGDGGGLDLVRRDLPELERLIHEKSRLGIVSALAASSPLSFGELKEILGVTDGNLSVHTRKLEEAGYLLCTKSFEGRIPRTEFSLTPQGRKALSKYLDHMEALVRAMRGGA